MKTDKWVVHNPKMASRVPFKDWLRSYMDLTDQSVVQHFMRPHELPSNRLMIEAFRTATSAGYRLKFKRRQT